MSRAFSTSEYYSGCIFSPVSAPTYKNVFVDKEYDWDDSYFFFMFKKKNSHADKILQ